MFNDQENVLHQRVAVVGNTVAQNMGLENSDALVGEQIRIGGVLFTVVGALAQKGTGSGFGDPDDQILIPLMTGRYKVIGTNWLRTIGALAITEDDMDLAMAEIQKEMRRQHKLRANQPDDFQIQVRPTS